MVQPRRRRWPALAGATVAACLSLWADAQQVTPVPFDPHISVYIAHSGTWFRYDTSGEERAEIEDPVAAFEGKIVVPDEAYDWAWDQINAPRVPPGWTFFSPVVRAPMRLRVRLQDRRSRLGQVVVSEVHSRDHVATLEANPHGSKVFASVLVDPSCEGFSLTVRDRSGHTLLRLGANNPKIEDAVPFTVAYDWEPNRGTRHTPCAWVSAGETLPPPWGDPRSTAGKLSIWPYPLAIDGEQAPIPNPRACAGGTWFEHDAPMSGAIPPTFPLKDKQIVTDTTAGWSGAGLPPLARQHVLEAIRKVREGYTGGRDVLTVSAAPPFSRGVVHWAVMVEGELYAVLYCPFRGHRHWQEGLSTCLQPYGATVRRVGLGRRAPSRALAPAVADVLADSDAWMPHLVGRPVAVGDIWGLTCLGSAATSFASPLEPTTTPVTFELHADNAPPGAPGLAEAWANAETAEPWTDVRPATPAHPDLRLDFSDPDSPCTCTVDLAKGWKWKATAQPSPIIAYSKGEAGPFEVPGNDTVRIECRLERLLCLKIKTVSESGENVHADVELELRADKDLWTASWVGETAPQPNGEQIWAYPIPFPPGTYRARARAGKAPYSEWHQFEVPVGIEQTETVTVPQG